MSATDISADFNYDMKTQPVLDSEVAYIDSGSGAPIVFLHGVPTWSYLWRNVIPHVEGLGRCLAPDLVGFGRSGKIPSGSYGFNDIQPYMEAWFDAMNFQEKVVLVLHDWGGAAGFKWAKEHEDLVAGIAYMETTVAPRVWDEFEGIRKDLFTAIRTPGKGEEIVLNQNAFIEKMLPGMVIRDLGDAELDNYRAPFPDAESRKAILAFPREVPVSGEPAYIVELTEDLGDWLQGSDLPKLLIKGDPGGNYTYTQADFTKTLKNQTEVTVKGLHFIQEDSPHEIGEAIASFVKKVRG